MRLNKKQRQELFEKYDGKCSYCGCELKKGWHADHLKPVIRNPLTKRMDASFNDNYENLMPACPSCNIHKHSLSLKNFRWLIANHIVALNRDYIAYKFAKKFGLVEETGKEVEFYFEKHDKEV